MATHRIDSVDGHGKAVRAPLAPPGAGLRWLESNVEHDSDECLVWPFGNKRRAYGAIRYEGVQTTAHRAMCLLAHGKPPHGDYEAAHSCHNPLCCNPRHLRWATPTENHADKIANDTTARGERNVKCRLTEQQARVIKYERSEESLTALGREYGVSKSTILDIRKHRTWAWL